MLENYCVLDFETQGLNWPWNVCQVLCYSTGHRENQKYVANTHSNICKLFEYLDKFNVLICHNAQFECGILTMLGYNIHRKDLLIIDTMILAKLYESNLMSYSLESLSERYFGTHKNLTELEKLADELKERKLIKFSKAQNKVKVMMKDLRLAYEFDAQTIEKYCEQDVFLTENLYTFLMKQDYGWDLEYWSDLIKCCVKSRAQGVNVSISAIERAELYLTKKIELLKEECFKIAGKEFNLNASHDFYDTIEGLKIKLPQTEDGNRSCTKAFMESQKHPVFEKILEIKKFQKLLNDFLIKMKGLIHNGKIYPEFRIAGADTTRFTSSNPNIQQIPARDKESLELCRGIFVAPEGKLWCSADYSAQEIRIQVHYAYLCNLAGAKELRDQYVQNPNLDLHQSVADMAGISRAAAKGLNLGLSYGMGINKMSNVLGVNLKEAEQLKNRYIESAPYLEQLRNLCVAASESKGFIKTLGGINLNIDQGFAYTKSLNYLIQGSAAHQTRAAMVECYRQGIDILFSVHDELNFLINSEKDAIVIKQIMENVVKLEVPVVAEVKIGNNWSACK